MKMAVEPDRGRLARGGVPPPIASAMAYLAEGLPEVIADVHVQLILRNSLAMESAVHLDGDGRAATIILDWAQLERLPLVMRAVDAARPLYEQEDCVREIFAREQRVYWKRRLAILNPSEISETDRRFDGAWTEKEKANAPPDPYDADEFAAAARYALYLLGHEIAHLVADANPQIKAENYTEFEKIYPRLIRPSAGLADELICDRLALSFVSDHDVYLTAADLNEEFSFMMAIERLQNEVRSAAPRLRAGLGLITDRENRIPFSAALEQRSVMEWTYRMFQIDLMLGQLMDAGDFDEPMRVEASRTRRDLYSWAEDSISEDYMGWRYGAGDVREKDFTIFFP